MDNLIADGWLYGYDLVIPKCPICGMAHRHGNHDYKKGDITARMSHCKKNRGIVHITIQGELTEHEYNDIVKCLDKKKYKKNHPFKSEEGMINVMCESCEKIFRRDNVLIAGNLHICPFCGSEGVYTPGEISFVVHGMLKLNHSR